MSTTKARLPVRTKFAFGLGSMAFGIKDQGFNALLMLYYNQVVGLPAAWVGLATLIATLVDGIADPVIGHASDNLRSRWGRRHPFMYAAALPIAIGYALLWSPIAAAPEIQFAWLLLSSIVVRVGISCYEIPVGALIPEFTDDYDERTSLATYRNLFQTLGLVIMGVLVFKVFLQPTPEQPVGQLNADGYVKYGLVAASVMLVVTLLSTWGTHHRIPTLRQPQREDHGGLRGLLDGLKVLLADRTYMSIVVCMFFFMIGVGASTTLSAYIGTYFWRMGPDQLAKIAGAAGGGVIIGLVLAGLARKAGKKAMCIGLFAVALAGLTLPVLAGLLGIAPREPSMVAVLAPMYAVVIGCVFAAVIMSWSMIADVADHIELKVGERMEGLMVSALVMVNKATSGVGVFIGGLILAYIGFPEKADPATIPVEVLDALGAAYVVTLVAFVGVALFSLSFYGITRESHAQAVEQLRQRAASAPAT